MKRVNGEVPVWEVMIRRVSDECPQHMLSPQTCPMKPLPLKKPLPLRKPLPPWAQGACLGTGRTEVER